MGLRCSTASRIVKVPLGECSGTPKTEQNINAKAKILAEAENIVEAAFNKVLVLA